MNRMNGMNRMDKQASDQKTKRKYPPWMWGLFLVPPLFLVANVIFVSQAMKTRSELVMRDYYAESLRHDARQAREERADSLGLTLHLKPGKSGWEARVAARPEVEGKAWLEGIQPDQAMVRILFYKPDDASLDFTAGPYQAVEAGDDGIAFVIPVSSLRPGVWKTKLSLLLRDIELEHTFEWNLDVDGLPVGAIDTLSVANEGKE